MFRNGRHHSTQTIMSLLISFSFAGCNPSSTLSHLRYSAMHPTVSVLDNATGAVAWVEDRDEMYELWGVSFRPKRRGSSRDEVYDADESPRELIYSSNEALSTPKLVRCGDDCLLLAWIEGRALLRGMFLSFALEAKRPDEVLELASDVRHTWHPHWFDYDLAYDSTADTVFVVYSVGTQTRVRGLRPSGTFLGAAARDLIPFASRMVFEDIHIACRGSTPGVKRCLAVWREDWHPTDDRRLTKGVWIDAEANPLSESFNIAGAYRRVGVTYDNTRDRFLLILDQGGLTHRRTIFRKFIPFRDGEPALREPVSGVVSIARLEGRPELLDPDNHHPPLDVAYRSPALSGAPPGDEYLVLFYTFFATKYEPSKGAWRLKVMQLDGEFAAWEGSFSFETDPGISERKGEVDAFDGSDLFWVVWEVDALDTPTASFPSYVRFGRPRLPYD